MKIIVLGNYTKSLVLFRGALIRRFVSLGHTVLVYAPEDDPDTADMLNSMGAEFRQLRFDRTGTNVILDTLFILRFWLILSREKPDILLSYTIKPVIFGSIAAKLAGIRRCFSVITGLGYTFIGDGTAKRLLRSLVTRLYKRAISYNRHVFFLNKDDFAVFSEHGILDQSTPFKLIDGEGIDINEYTDSCKVMTQTAVINGSGIDLAEYCERPIEKSNIVFLMIARLLRDKGIQEYVDAARIVKENYPAAQFWLVGPLDSNPSAFSLADVQQWSSEGVVTYHGETRDVRPYIKGASVYVLPSYREGLPRTVLEAMAMGRPIITTDAPGCRETVVDGDNGFLVPIKDAPALAHAMEQFILHPELIDKMGHRSRDIVVERFDVNKVNTDILQAMGLI